VRSAQTQARRARPPLGRDLARSTAAMSAPDAGARPPSYSFVPGGDSPRWPVPTKKTLSRGFVRSG
jgi:hypothetical protein